MQHFTLKYIFSQKKPHKFGPNTQNNQIVSPYFVSP